MKNVKFGQMKKKISLLFLVSLLIFSSLGTILGAEKKVEKKQPTLQSIPDFPTVFKLLEQQDNLDGKRISFQGELIGQAIYEKKGVFVNLMDQEFNALGIYMDKSFVKKFTHYGRHGTKGDFVKATGTFHKVCTQHGGDTDLHASEIQILKTGETIPEPKVSPVKITLSLLLPLLALFLFLHKKKH
jgi:hypothetical protein